LHPVYIFKFNFNL